MAAMRYFEFKSAQLAKSFIAGVEFVNDSALEVQGVFWVPASGKRAIIDGRYFVAIADMDKPKNESDRKPKGWNKARLEAQ